MIRSILVACAFALIAAPALAFPAVIVAEAGFSAGPGSDYDIFGKLPTGTTVDVIWCGTHAEWCLIKVHKTMGWLPESDLIEKSVSGLVPIEGNSNGGNSVAGSGDANSGVAATLLPPGKPTGPGLHPVGPIASPSP